MGHTSPAPPRSPAAEQTERRTLPRLGRTSTAPAGAPADAVAGQRADRHPSDQAVRRELVQWHGDGLPLWRSERQETPNMCVNSFTSQQAESQSCCCSAASDTAERCRAQGGTCNSTTGSPCRCGWIRASPSASPRAALLPVRRRRRGGSCRAGPLLPPVRQTPLFAPFIYNSDLFTKTGSGQTTGSGQHRKNGVLHRCAIGG